MYRTVMLLNCIIPGIFEKYVLYTVHC